MSGVITPSYRSGLYSPRRGGIPEHPGLWRGCVFAAAPCLRPSGIRLHDHSIRSDSATLINMDPATDWVVNAGQYALDFDGTNDYAQTASTDNRLLTGRMSVSAWVSFQKYTGTQAIVSNLGGGDGTFQLEFSRTAGKISFLQNGASIAIESTQSIGDANWRHVVVTRDGQTGAWNLTSYINLATTTATTSTNPSAAAVAGNVTIGRAGGLNLQYLDGLVSDVAIWNRSLSVNEVARLYYIGRGGMYAQRKRRDYPLPFALPSGTGFTGVRGTYEALGT